MDKQIYERWKDKRVKIFLKNDDQLTGSIIEVNEEGFIFKDRYGDEIPISFDFVNIIKPLDGGWK
jgi:ribosome maturation factor RimP